MHHSRPAFSFAAVTSGAHIFGFPMKVSFLHHWAGQRLPQRNRTGKFITRITINEDMRCGVTSSAADTFQLIKHWSPRFDTNTQKDLQTVSWVRVEFCNFTTYFSGTHLIILICVCNVLVFPHILYALSKSSLDLITLPIICEYKVFNSLLTFKWPTFTYANLRISGYKERQVNYLSKPT
jgi:hypothetical protein